MTKTLAIFGIKEYNECTEKQFYALNKLKKGETTMIKRLKSVLLLLLTLCLLLTGCGQKTTPPDNGDGTQNEDGTQNKNGGNNDGNQNTEGTENGGETNESQGLESGFKIGSSGEPLPPPMFCAYKSDITAFEIDKVSLEFFWGGWYPSGIEIELARGSNYPEFDLYFKNEEGEMIQHIKHVDENFVSEKYSCDVVWNDGYEEIKFKYSENISVPAEAFTDESGYIYFMIYGTNIKTQTQRYECITCIRIYYKVIGDTVVLSAQRIE